MSKLDVIILCGGEGTRLKHVTGEIPKCVYPIGDKPFILYMIDYLSAFDVIDKFILCCSDKLERVRDALYHYYLGEDDDSKWYTSIYRWFTPLYSRGKLIKLVGSDSPRGTFLGMLEAVPYLTNKYALIMNGDTYCEINPASMLFCHQSEELCPITACGKDGIDAGIWITSTLFLKVFPILLKTIPTKREALLAISNHYEGPNFIDIGTPEGLQKANDYLKNPL